MQGDRNAVTGERGDDGCLIADAVKTILSCAADVTVRNMRDRDRLRKQRLRTGESHREMWTVPLHLREEFLPAVARACQMPLLHHPAEVCSAALNRLDSAIATGIEHQLRRVRQLSGLRVRQPKIHLESDPSLRILGTRMAAEIVLACCEKDRCSLTRRSVVERSLPRIAFRPIERL